MTREITNKILEAVEEGLLDRDTVIMACLKYMSEDDVADMARSNEFFEDDEDEAEYEFTDDDEVNEAFAESWETACNEDKSLRNDKPAKRQFFSMFVDQLCKDARISAELANDVTLSDDD